MDRSRAGQDATAAAWPPESTTIHDRRPARAHRLLLAACLVVALALRLAGLSYGFVEHVHSDTIKQLHRVAPFFSGDLVPDTTYPTLHMYVVALLLRAWALLDPRALEGGPTWPQIVLTVRLLNAALGTATVLLLHLTGRWLLGWPVGLLAAAFLALSPVSIIHAHYEMGDVPQAFFMMAAVAVAACTLRHGRPGAVLGVGALAGLAAAAKFFGVLVLVSAPLVLRARRVPLARAGALAAGAALLAVAVFVLGTPMLWLAPRQWLGGTWQSHEVFWREPPPPPGTASPGPPRAVEPVNPRGSRASRFDTPYPAC
jgi:hypothetical protein